MIEKNYPLVSIVIITYNSSEFIIECLDSIQAQTYKNIELIISDDCSQDETVSVCRKWIEKNKNRFTNIEHIEAEKNTGITKNINRGCKIAKGKWIKPLAGDDILLPECVEKNLEHCEGRNIVFSQAEIFSGNNRLGLAVSEEAKYYFQLSAKGQFKKLFLSNFIPAASSFINTKYLKSMNYFDESYKMVEDYPFWLLSTYHGTKLYFFDIITVQYRKHENAISSNHNTVFNVEMYDFEKKFYKSFVKQYNVHYLLKFCRFIILLIQEKTISNGNDIKSFNKYSKLKYLNICKYLNKIKEIIYK